jgi:Tfp pilus assembly protein PilZ
MLPKAVSIFNPVEIELDISDGENKINCNATIVWVVHSGEIGKNKSVLFDTGIEFSDLKNDDRLRIEKVIQECLQQNKS